MNTLIISLAIRCIYTLPFTQTERTDITACLLPGKSIKAYISVDDVNNCIKSVVPEKYDKWIFWHGKDGQGCMRAPYQVTSKCYMQQIKKESDPC